jgi:hypothetical protein
MLATLFSMIRGERKRLTRKALVLSSERRSRERKHS